MQIFPDIWQEYIMGALYTLAYMVTKQVLERLIQVLSK